MQAPVWRLWSRLCTPICQHPLEAKEKDSEEKDSEEKESATLWHP